MDLSSYIAEITASIYTTSITTRENKLRANMRILREKILNDQVDMADVRREVLSNCLWFGVLDRDSNGVRGLMRHCPDTDLARCDLNMLWMAIIRGDLDIAWMLVEAGASVNARTEAAGPSFLHFLAICSDDDERRLLLAEFMIRRGAEVNARTTDINRSSVLQTALRHGSVGFVRLLVENGAHVGSLDVVLAAGRSRESLPILVDSTDDPAAKLAWVFGALQCLIEMKEDDENLAAIDAVLRLGLPVLQLDVAGWTILRMAVYYGRVRVVKLLLDYGADANQKSESENGNFPLFWAATSDNSSLVELLVSRGADVRARNDSGRSAIHAACQSASLTNIELLLRSGASVGVVDNYNATPFSLLGDGMSEPRKLIIGHLAALVSDDDDDVNDADLSKIRQCPEMRDYYDECLRKLREK